MTARLIDSVCAYHRAEILDTRLWPDRDATCPDCSHYAAGPVRLLPDLDMLHCIALHESAHAVAYLHLGCPVIEVTLAPDGTGAVNFLYREPQPVGVWAGTEAVRRMLLNAGRPSDADLLDAAATGGVGDTSDAELLHHMARGDVAVMAARDTAADLVDRNWTGIVRVAELLLAHGCLDGAVVATVAGVEVLA